MSFQSYSRLSHGVRKKAKHDPIHTCGRGRGVSRVMGMETGPVYGESMDYRELSGIAGDSAGAIDTLGSI